jgi:hypothetical protein
MLDSRLVEAAKRKKLVVHLGNVGEGAANEVLAEKTRNYALRFKGVHFVGIDTKKFSPTISNWTQIQADFKEGLKRIPNHSARVISSEMALTWYYPEHASKEDYLEEVAALARKKLADNGKFIVSTGSFECGEMIRAMVNAGFRLHDVTGYQITPGKEFTFWQRDFSPTYQLIAVKRPESTRSQA